MSERTLTLENQLWLWLDECESRKPRASLEASGSDDKAVRVLQYGVRESSEARRAGDSIKGPSLNLQ